MNEFRLVSLCISPGHYNLLWILHVQCWNCKTYLPWSLKNLISNFVGTPKGIFNFVKSLADSVVRPQLRVIKRRKREQNNWCHNTLLCLPKAVSLHLGNFEVLENLRDLLSCWLFYIEICGHDFSSKKDNNNLVLLACFQGLWYFIIISFIEVRVV